jgi:transglutaminase-like putative cysteine protease
MSTETMESYLQPTYFLDSNSEAVRGLAESLTADKNTDVDKAVALFYWVRDTIRYDPYSYSVDPAAYQASAIIQKKVGWCVPKAVLLAALTRAAGIPSRLHFADIRNFQISEKLLEAMKTDIFYYHGYTEIYLNGAWVKATPAFNIELCEKTGQQPVEFDGLSHGMLPTETCRGEKHIEYVKDRGVSPDLPLEEMSHFFSGIYDFETMAPQPGG